MIYSNNGDVFCEVSVSHKTGSTEILKIALAIVLGLAATVFVFLIMPQLFFLLFVVWAALIFWIRLQNIAYEYSFTSGDLDIDKLISDYKRKHLMTVIFDQIEIIAPENSFELNAYQYGQYRTYHYDANDPMLKNYVIVANIDNAHARIIFTPNDKMLGQMRQFAPRKVVTA